MVIQRNAAAVAKDDKLRYVIQGKPSFNIIIIIIMRFTTTLLFVCYLVVLLYCINTILSRNMARRCFCSVIVQDEGSPEHLYF